MIALLDVLRLLRPWWSRLGVAVGAGVGAAAFSVVLTGTAGWLIVTAAGGVPVLTLMVAIVVVRACGFGRAVLRYVERLASHDAVLRSFGTIRSRLVRELGERLGTGRQRLEDADALSRTTADVDDLQDAVVRGLLPWLASAVASSVVVVATLVILPAAGWAVLGIVVIGVVLAPALLFGSEAGREELMVRTRGDRDRTVAEILRGMDDLVATGRVPRAVQDVATHDAHLTTISRGRALAAGIRASLAVLLAGSGSVAVIMVGIPAVRSGTLAPALFAVVVLLPLALGDALRSAVDSATALARTAAASRRVLGLMTPFPMPVASPVVASPRRPAVLLLEGVSVRWPGAPVDALVDVDLQLTAGERVAVVGPSGAGKSTLAALLLGFLVPRTGRILLDGVEVSEMPGSSWVPADAHLFDSTVERNLRLGAPAATDEMIDAAARTANLNGWITTLPQGLATRVGPAGGLMSGGQRQRVAVARALLALDADPGRPAFLLVADEPSAHLDAISADIVTHSLLTPDPDRVTVLITHRRQDLAMVDRVLTVSGGQVREAVRQVTRNTTGGPDVDVAQRPECRAGHGSAALAQR